MTVPIIVICGATATGKSDLAVAVAEQLGREIINGDSMQVYADLDIGAGKPSDELLGRVPHHGIGHVPLTAHYSAAAFTRDMDPVLDRLTGAGVPPVVCGGTGLYLRALLEGIFPGPPRDPDLRAQLQARAALVGVPALHAELAQVDPTGAERIADNDEQRVVRALEVYRLTGMPISRQHAKHAGAAARPGARWYGLRLERDDLRQRVADRVHAMFAAGLVDEVRGLCGAGHEDALRRLKPLGYLEVLDALAAGTDAALVEAEALTVIHTQQFAKRQGTWFRNQHAVEWLDVGPGETGTMWTKRIAWDVTPSPDPI